MKKLFLVTSIVLTSQLFGFEACGENEKEALANLSSTIVSNISNDYTQTLSTTRNNESEEIENKIDSIMKVTSNLSLVNIKFSQKEKEICAAVVPQEQIENTQLHLQNALLLNEINLPKDINEKVKKLKLWIEQIQQANNLVLAFLKPSLGAKQTPQEIENIIKSLQQKEKIFTDLYTAGILKADSLIFKTCESSKEKAYKELNKLLFKSKTKQKDDEGIFDKASSLFNFFKTETLMLDLFSKQVTYAHENKKECALIKKEELLSIAQNLNQDLQRFSTQQLSKNPKERYTHIKDYEEHLNVTKALLEVFPEHFSKNDFSKITATKKELATILETTYPQYVLFRIAGDTQNIKIKLGDRFVEQNTKHYIKNGDYTYSITADNKCPIKGEFSLKLLKDITIDEDFSDMNLPILNFYTQNESRIIVDGKNIRPNVETLFHKCEGDVRYIANYANQEKSDTISLTPNLSKTIELRFLTPEELKILSDAKTKNFLTTSGVAFSESLTPLSNKNIRFIVEDDSEHGELDLHESGSFTYKSKNDFIGLDSFKYIVKINDEKSAPKVVNITVNASTVPVAVPAKSKDLNQTVMTVEPKTEETKKEDSKIIEKATPSKSAEQADQEAEERYQKFKIYVDSQEQNVEKLQKLQKAYPKMFERLLKEKLEQGGM